MQQYKSLTAGAHEGRMEAESLSECLSDVTDVRDERRVTRTKALKGQTNQSAGAKTNPEVPVAVAMVTVVPVDQVSPWKIAGLSVIRPGVNVKRGGGVLLYV